MCNCIAIQRHEHVCSCHSVSKALICSFPEGWDASEARCMQKASDLCHSRQEVTMLERLTARTPTQWTLPIDALQ